MTQRENYTHGHHDSVLRSHGWRTVENSAAYLEPHLRAGVTVLDVGCGPGTITVDIALRVAPARVVGLDASTEVVEKARALARDRGAANVEFVVADAYSLPFGNAEFDIVHTHQTLQHVADPVAVLREMRRVRTTDGVAAAREVDYPGVFWHPSSAGLDRWYALYEAVHRGNGGEPAAGRHLASWARKAGFENVVASASIWNFRRMPSAPGGGRRGPSAHSTPPLPTAPWGWALRTEPTWRRCRRRGWSGPQTPMAPCSCRTVRCWPGGSQLGRTTATSQRLRCKEVLAKDELQRSTCKEVFAMLSL